MERTLTRYNLGALANVPPGEGRTFEVAGQQIAIFRTRHNQLYATQATCPHKGGPLADGIVGAGKVICPLHSYKFALATGEPVGNPCNALTTYPVTLNEEEQILLTLE